MTVQGHVLESTANPAAALDARPGKLSEQLLPKDYKAFSAQTSATPDTSADKHLAPVNIVDDKTCEKPKGFWERLGESIGTAMEWEAYANGGPVPPEQAQLKPCPPAGASSAPSENMTDVPSVNAGAAPPETMGNVPDSPGNQLDSLSSNKPVKNPDKQPEGASTATQPDNTSKQPESAATQPDSSAKQPEGAATQPDSSAKAPDVTVRLPELTILPESKGETTTPPPADSPSPLMKGVQDNMGKSVQELEPGINPRLGCVRMVSHVLHEADPSFPETNNTAAFRKALLEHGYEAITVPPGDPSLAQGQAGDVIVGQRPDGMPSHSAINMGNGEVFNNNSDTGKGQLDSLDQFNQGMHDKSGHWMKNGFESVTIYRKVEATTNSITGF